MLHARDSSAHLARALAAPLVLCCCLTAAQAETHSQTPTFTIHGMPKTCSAIWQMDSALSSGSGGFFSGWTEQDYANAAAWAAACSTYGWHVPGRPRLSLLHSQHDAALGQSPTRPVPGAVMDTPRASLPLETGAAPRPRLKWSATHELPSDGSTVVGFDATVTAHYHDTLPDIARRYGLGYEEIRRANPGVDVWLPGEGTRILLPGRHRLPPGSHQGVVVNLAERRLYFFPKATDTEKPVVISYPVSVGKVGERTPLGQTVIIAKVEHPSWVPPASVRKEHLERGDRLPAVVGPGPDNPLGDFMLRLGFGDGTYEIHGTNKPVSVGMDSTDGCIGMYPEDVAALFTLVDVGTPVRLIDQSL